MKRILFMKVGGHAREKWPEIIVRKIAEQENVGYAFWGYSSTICHPRTQVLPFVAASMDPVDVVMTVIKSATHFDSARGREYHDGKNWSALPNSVEVRGSRWALVIEDLRSGSGILDLSPYRVAIGPKRGSPASQYIRFQVDKGCFELSEQPSISSLRFPIHFTARLRSPYAVLIR
jgi:hypothetical protein